MGMFTASHQEITLNCSNYWLRQNMAIYCLKRHKIFRGKKSKSMKTSTLTLFNTFPAGFYH